jgi:exosortase
MGCVVSIFGRHAILRFLPAAVVVMFLVPVPGRIRLEISMPLQGYTAMIAEHVLEVLGADVSRSNNLLSINGQPVTIIEACNGLRMVFALILVSYAFGFGMPLRNSVRILILILSPIAAIFCNLVRIVPTMWLYGYFPKGSSAGANFHTYSGWMMLPIAFLLLLGIIKILRWAMIPVMRYTLAGQ